MTVKTFHVMSFWLNIVSLIKYKGFPFGFLLHDKDTSQKYSIFTLLAKPSTVLIMQIYGWFPLCRQYPSNHSADLSLLQPEEFRLYQYYVHYRIHHYDRLDLVRHQPIELFQIDLWHDIHSIPSEANVRQ